MRQGEPAAVARFVVDLIADPKAPAADRRWAAEFFTERTEGKVEQAMRLAMEHRDEAEHDEDAVADRLTNEELDELDRLDEQRERLLTAARERESAPKLPATTGVVIEGKEP